MKTKLEMAHEWAMKHGDAETVGSRQNMVKYAWDYADAMQAEADKRENKETCDKSLNIDSKEQSIEEWQPDWSQAPDWANWWAMDENKNTRWIYSELEQPYTSDIFLRWFAVGRFDSADAPSFGYTGDWRESLRKRPK